MTDTKKKRLIMILLIGAVAGVLGVPCFAILHNVFYSLSSMASHHVLLSQFLSGLSMVSFVLALIVCPVVVIICLVWAAMTGMLLTSLGRR